MQQLNKKFYRYTIPGIVLSVDNLRDFRQDMVFLMMQPATIIYLKPANNLFFELSAETNYQWVGKETTYEPEFDWS